MAKITKSTGLFPSELVTDVFSKVKGHSTLALLTNQTPIPFTGSGNFVFSMDGEASIVGEGLAKPAGEAEFKSVVIKPIKFVYQHRLTDEFINMSEEQQIPYMQAFADGFAKKMARALDIASFHGVNPADKTSSDQIGTNHFDSKVTNKITLTSEGKQDDAVDDAVTLIQAVDGEVTGIAMAPAFASGLGKMKDTNQNAIYPEFRFGGNPGHFGQMKADINSTVSFGTAQKDLAIVGDFENAVRWGYAESVPMEIIEYGDPDGQGDLKKSNQIILRAEAYIGWGILDEKSFARIEKQ